MRPTDMAELFAELLELDDVAPDDNFFDLGGNSVLALQVLLEARKRWGVGLSLLDVVQHPTPEGLAACGAGGPASHG